MFEVTAYEVHLMMNALVKYRADFEKRLKRGPKKEQEEYWSDLADAWDTNIRVITGLMEKLHEWEP